MKHYIRIVQTDAVDEPEIHEDFTDIKDAIKAEKDAIKDSLKDKMIAINYKYQTHICDHDESNGRGCKLEDI